jgi:hypothetical protein
MMQDEQQIAGPLGWGGRGEHPLRLAHIALGHSREELGLLGKDALGQVDVAHRPTLRTWMSPPSKETSIYRALLRQ